MICFCVDQCPRIRPLAATTTTITSACPKCGVIAKSGEISCCGRGGSWFRNCGSAGNAKLHHTWYEGIQVCKTRVQPKRASGRHSNAAHQLNSSNVFYTGNSTTVMTTTKEFAFTSANTSTPISFKVPSIVPTKAFMSKWRFTSGSTSIDYDPVKTIAAAIISTPITRTSTTTTTPVANTNTFTTATTSTITSAITQTANVESKTVTDWLSQGMCYARNVS